MAKLNDDLSAEFVRSILDYDPQTGILTWKRRDDRTPQWNSRYAGKEAGLIVTAHDDIKYRSMRVDHGHYKVHRIIWLYMTGSWPKAFIDHINGDGLDNRWTNLREATIAENAKNRRPNRNNTSGFKGVSFAKHVNKYLAQVNVNSKRVCLGYFDTPEEAYAAYCDAAKKHYGDYARLA